MSSQTDSQQAIRQSIAPLRPMLIVAAMLILCSCASPGSKRPAAIVTSDSNGFSISEAAGVRSWIRSDFAKANQALEAGALDRGIELLTEIAESSPELAAVHINLGVAYQRVENFELAEASLREAIAINPRHPVAHNELGIVYRRTGRFEESRKSYEAALELQPSFHFARKNLAIVCDLFISDTQCALEHYELYLTAVPNDKNIEIWIADLRNRIEQ
jgi:tetratricopeptide (TPR) repeat protein